MAILPITMALAFGLLAVNLWVEASSASATSLAEGTLLKPHDKKALAVIMGFTALSALYSLSPDAGEQLASGTGVVFGLLSAVVYCLTWPDYD